jgi:hypothetical protein
MFGLGNNSPRSQPHVSKRYCTDRFSGKYPHVGLYDCRERKVWVAKSLNGQAIRTAHARLITGADNATSTVWKDRFLCFWFFSPDTGEGYIHGYPIDWKEAHLLVRIDPHWDYDRQRMIAAEMEDHVNDNLERQFRHGETIFAFYAAAKLKYPVSLHYMGHQATDSQFYVKRLEGNG